MPRDDVARGNRDAPVDLDEGGDHARVVHAAAALAQDLQGRRLRHAAAIRTIRRERVEAVDDRQDPRADRDVLAADAARVAGAVPVLVMAVHDRHDGIRELHEREDVRADVDVALHLLELRVRQLARLVEDVLGHGQLPGVVQQRGRFDRLQLELVGDAERPRQADRVGLDPADVAVRHVVLRVDRHRERLDRGQIEPVHGAEVAARIFRASERGPERQVEHDQQRHDHDHRERADLLDQENEAERQGRRRQVADREPLEMPPPDLDRGLRVSRPTAIAVSPEFSAK